MRLGGWKERLERRGRKLFRSKERKAMNRLIGFLVTTMVAVLCRVRFNTVFRWVGCLLRV